MQRIFKWFTDMNEQLSLVRITWFVEQFGIEEFEGAEKILWLFLRYCADLDVPALKQYLTAFLQTDGKKLIKKHNIRLDTMENFNYTDPASLEEANRVIASVVHTIYDTYCKIDLANHSFTVDMKMFMEEARVQRLQRLMATSFPRLTNGDDIEELTDDLSYGIDRIREVYNFERLHDLDFMSGASQVERGVSKMRLLFKTSLPCINGDLGGVFSKMLISLTGSPGSGKTRMAVSCFAYVALISGIGVRFDELELSEEEVRNMFIAHHIVHLYKGKIKIADSDMNKGNLSSEQERYYEAAKMDLFESGKYGRLVLRTEDLVVETLYRKAISFFKHNRDIQFWVIDYAGLAKSKPTEKYARFLEEYQIITELYKTVKDFIKFADIGALILNQYNEKGIEAARAGKRILPGHTQGGQIVAKHTDYDLAMGMTEEQELANIRTLSTVKKRAATGFQNKQIKADCAVSLFRQLTE